MAELHHLRPQTQVRLRRPGPAPDRLGVQGVRADDADPRLRRRPEHDLLQLEVPAPRAGCPGTRPTSVHTAEEPTRATINITKATTVSDNTVFAQLGVDVGHGQGRRDGARDGDHRRRCSAIPSEVIGGLKVGVSPLQMADAYATMANGGYHIAPTDHRQGRVPERQGRQPRQPDPAPRSSPTARRTPATQVLKTVITERNRHRGQLRLPGGRQDRHDEQLHRRLVRRLHAEALDRGLGRLPARDDVDERRQRARPGLRRHARRADLARLHAEAAQRLLRRLHAADGPVPGHAVLRH